MESLFFQNKLHKEFVIKFPRSVKNTRLTIASLISLGVLALPYHVLAADLGSQVADNIVLNNGDRIIADHIHAANTLAGILSKGTANINLAQDVTITAEGNNLVNAIEINGNNGVLTADRLTINAKGSNLTSGIMVTGANNRLDLGSDSHITVGSNSVSGNGYGISLANGSTLNANRLTIDSQMAGIALNDAGTKANLGEGSTIKANRLVGVLLSNGSVSDNIVFEASKLSIMTQGNGVIGISMGKYTSANLGSGSSVETEGDNAIGIAAQGEFTADALTISTQGSGSVAFGVVGESTVNIGANSHISANDSIGMNIGSIGGASVVNFRGSVTERNSVYSTGAAPTGVATLFANSTLNLAYTDINIDSSQGAGYGVIAMSKGTFNGDNLTINGNASTTGILAVADGKVNLTGDTAINLADPNEVAISNGEATLSLTGGMVNASGKMTINGSVLSYQGTTDLDMQSGSLWHGKAQNDLANNGVINLSLTDSQWNMTADSTIDKLVLNQSIVDFSAGSPVTRLSRNGNSDDKFLTVGDLSGNGHFVLHTNIVGDGHGVNNSGDRLIVTGTSAGNHQLTVLNRGSLATTGDEVLTLVETQDGQATFTSTGQTELGGYLYDVRKNGNDWQMYAVGAVPPKTDPKPDPDPEDKPNPPITTTADAGANFLNVGYLMNYAETQTLLQRMGDLRQNSDRGNMWLRGFAGKFDSFSGGKLSRFDMSYSGMQLGADKRLSAELPLFIGLFMGQAHGSPDYRSGDGTTKSDSAGLYATYLASNGFYLDGVAKYTHVKNSFNVKDTQDNRVSGNGNADGFSVSLESGQKFSLNQPGNGFYIEPQAQFTYSHQGASNIVASNGLKIDLGSYESMTGRASTLLGYELSQGDNTFNVYLKTGIVREFEGDVDYRLNGSAENHTFKGNWWNNGVGVSAQLAKQHTFYLSADSSTGHKFDQRQINGGYRFSF
ncbi:hypothetical protein SOASR032_01430 [Pragia fontium]|uniref:Autotransporter domain-containing protein n=1 Tax=Pragia fontium TaxID=82985 RepID=A0ABQ5LDX3_9GAMM|nr:autotransporter outer membrane beta-barrel domain-containing protein [Pragia fontium]GKX61574.1 hypothetical protein SOASR032_01430 [Pragia fontium]